MTAKEEYIEFCNSGEYIPLFHQPYWWDILNDKWDVKKIEYNNQTAFLPFSIEKKYGFRFARNPHLTPYSGPLMKSKTIELDKSEILKLAMKSLAKFAYVEYDCNPQFFGRIASKKTKKTYLLNLEESIENIENNFKPSLRRQLKKASKNLHISKATEIETLYNLYSESIKYQSGANIIPKKYLAQVYKLCKEKQLGEIYLATDQDKHIHAAILYVADDKCGYYLLGGSSKEHLGSGAMGFLLWHCIKEAHKTEKKLFDFEGSENPGVARFFSTFGGEEINYPVIKNKPSFLLQVFQRLKP